MITLDKMLTEIMGYPAYRVEGLETALEESPVFAYTKVAINDLAALRFFYEQGFNLVDTSTTFDKPFVRQQTLSHQTEIRFAQPEDEAQLVQVAGNSFVYSRFHQDPLLEKPIADQIKAVWAGNFFKGQRGDAMIVSVVEGQVAGFLQLLYKGETLVIDLIAVGEKYRRRSIASDLIAFAQLHCPPHEAILVSTQLANLPSMRLYERLGFRINSAQHIFHYHK